jgi:hypothetical protein
LERLPEFVENPASSKDRCILCTKFLDEGILRLIKIRRTKKKVPHKSAALTATGPHVISIVM